MALAEKMLAAEFNRPGHDVVDHRTWVFLGDGCLMEGISHEVCSLAGTLKLGKLIAFFDDNGISIDGNVKGWCADDTPARFEAYGWNVVRAVDGHDAAAVAAAIDAALKSSDKPTLICCRTVIGWGSPNKAGTKATHGEALGAEEVAATRAKLGWNSRAVRDSRRHRRGLGSARARRDRAAVVAGALRRAMKRRIRMPRANCRGAWPASCRRISKPSRIGGWRRRSRSTRRRPRASPRRWCSTPSARRLASWWAVPRTSPVRTTPSARIRRRSRPPSAQGNYINYGVREFGMTAIMNGMVLHGGFRPYAGTFLVFSDYARNAVRMAALMKLGVIAGLHARFHRPGRGRPHAPAHRAPGQPARDAEPVAVAAGGCRGDRGGLGHRPSAARDGPTALVLTRQALPQQPRTREQGIADHAAAATC